MTKTTTQAAARFAVQEVGCIDPNVNGTLYWQFTGWQYSADRLLTRAQADAELARLQERLPHAAGRMSVVDVVESRERAAIYGPAFRAVIATAPQVDGRAVRTPELLAAARRAGADAVARAGYKVAA